MKKFAYILMGNNYNPETHKAEFTAGNTIHYICTVQNFEQAKTTVQSLIKDGVGAIEVCGAFGRERAQELIALTGNKVSIAYVVHELEQNSLIEDFFS